MRYSELLLKIQCTDKQGLKKQAQNKFPFLPENETIQRNLRPHLVIVKSNTALSIDITLQFENRMEALTEATQHKLLKCEDLARGLSNRFSELN
jgi:hypothetical protein